MASANPALKTNALRGTQLPGAKEYSPDGHHAEGDVARGHVVGAANLVDFVRLGHHHRVMLHHHSVGVHSALLGKRRCRNVMVSGEVFNLLIIAG